MPMLYSYNKKGFSNYVFHLVLTLTQLVFQKGIKDEQLLSTFHMVLISELPHVISNNVAPGPSPRI